MRIAAVAGGLRQQRIERTTLRRREIEPDHARVGQLVCKCRQNFGERLFEHQHFRRRIGKDEHLLGGREPPVQRHQHRAEPRAGIEQHQIVGTIEAEDRDAVAAADAEFGFQRSCRGLDTFEKRAIAENLALKNERRLVRAKTPRCVR